MAAGQPVLLYVSDEEGGKDVYWIGLDRSGAPAGKPVRITTGLDPHGISLSGDGRRLLYSVHSETSNIYRVALQPGRTVSLSGAQPVTTGSQLIESFSISPDGKWLAFDSNRSGNQDIWRMPLDGSARPRRSAPDPRTSSTHYSPDGQWVAFHATRSGSVRDLYIMPAAGGRRAADPGADGQQLAPRILTGRAERDVHGVGRDRGAARSRRRAARPGDSGWARTTRTFTLPGSLTGTAEWSPDGRWLIWPQDNVLLRGDADGGNPRTIDTIPPDFSAVLVAMVGGRPGGVLLGHLDRRGLPYLPGPRGRRPEAGGRAVGGADLPELSLRFDVHGGTLYFALADRQSDVWQAEVLLR